jgi:hypothetical protein
VFRISLGRDFWHGILRPGDAFWSISALS